MSKRVKAMVCTIAGALGAAVVGVAIPDAWQRVTCGLGMTACFDVSVQVETDLDRFGGATDLVLGSYVFPPGRFPSLPTPPSCGNGHRFQEWALAAGGRPHGLQQLKVSITANDEPVLVDFAEVVTTRQPYAPGDVATCISGGQLDVRSLDVDLDTGSTRYYPDPGNPEQVGGPMALHIEPGMAEVFAVTADADDHDVTWRVRLGMIIAGERVERWIDDGGAPFFLAASRTDQRTVYSSVQAGRWQRLPPAYG